MDDMIEGHMKKIEELEHGGIKFLNNKIEEYKKKEGVKPILDVEIHRLQILMLKTIPKIQSLEGNMLVVEMMNYLLDRSFECKILEYELTKAQEKITMFEDSNH